MRKLFNTFFVIIAAMVTFAGCQKEENNAPATQTKTVEFFAESIETKTQFDTPVDGVYPTIWNKGDRVKIFLNLESANGTEATSEVQLADADAQTSSSARFEAEIAEVEAPSYTFYAVVPSVAYKSSSRDAATNKFVLTIPSSQDPLDGTVAKSAQVLLAKVTEETMPSSVSMNFGHITAYGKFSLTGLSEDVTVKSIVIETQEGLSLAGEFEYNVNDGALSASAGKNTLTLMTSKKQDIWFACAPVDVSNTSVTFTVDTDKGVYVRNVEFPAERKFESGKISSFSISFADISPVVSEKYYQKVTAAPSDWSGKYLIVYESGTNAYVFNGQDAVNGYVSATISDGKITSTDGLAAVQVTIESMAGGYAVKTANGYIYGTQGDNELDFNASTEQLNTISLDNDGVSLTSNTSVLRFNNASNQMRFRYYKSTSYTGQQPIWLYKLVGGESGGEEEPDTPAAPVQLEMSDITCSAKTANTLTFTWTSVPNATKYEVIFDNGSAEEVTTTTYEATGLEAETEYTISVKAVGDGTNYTTSEAKTQTGTTTAAQGGGEGGEIITAGATWQSKNFASGDFTTSGKTANISTTGYAAMDWTLTKTGTGTLGTDSNRGVQLQANAEIKLTTAAYVGGLNTITLALSKSSKGLSWPSTLTVTVDGKVFTSSSSSVTSSAAEYKFTCKDGMVDATGKTIVILIGTTKSSTYLKYIKLNCPPVRRERRG